jgi:hypothetical protein
MELVRGIPITEHCDKHQLDTSARLELFVTICHAFQHAHQKGIIQATEVLPDYFWSGWNEVD